MYGGVGVGKTMLMDLLAHNSPPQFKVTIRGWVGACAMQGGGCTAHGPGWNRRGWSAVQLLRMLWHDMTQSPHPAVQLLRTHYHDFMLDVHGKLRHFQKTADPLALVADEIADASHVRNFE